MRGGRGEDSANISIWYQELNAPSECNVIQTVLNNSSSWNLGEIPREDLDVESLRLALPWGVAGEREEQEENLEAPGRNPGASQAGAAAAAGFPRALVST